ncbi:MAG: THUMP domain-containing class I SAM-dependent RNA methyltransferase [Eubacterium sp.]|jgi:putative N6-adenine-specific DNA methylase
MKLELIATATFGLEAVVRREIEELGYKILRTEDAKITYLGDERAIAKSNLWLRTADRVLIKVGEFKADTFEDLFQQVKALPWENFVGPDGKVNVSGTSVKSVLHSVPACQSIAKKAISLRLGEFYSLDRLPETGAVYPVKLTLLKDRVTVTLDTSGVGLHKRSYRVANVEAPVKETLAAAMVELSYWNAGRVLVDPCCGSGTIPIEAAMIARNIAPGLSRRFAAEDWDFIPREIWKEERKAAFGAIDRSGELKIFASDIDRRAVSAARENALEAGVDEDISFSVMDVSKFKAPCEYGIIITNPPYGERIGSRAEIEHIYDAYKAFFTANPTWSLFMITTDKDVEQRIFGRPADRRRKLYNGRLQTCYYQFHGTRPGSAADKPGTRNEAGKAKAESAAGKAMTKRGAIRGAIKERSDGTDGKTK